MPSLESNRGDGSFGQRQTQTSDETHSIFAPARSKGSKMERMPLIRGVVASGFSGPSQTLGAPYLMVVMPPGQQRAGHTDAIMKLLWTAGWSQNQFQSSKGSEYLHLPSKHKYPHSPPFQIWHFHWLLGFPHLKRNPAFLFPFL